MLHSNFKLGRTAAAIALGIGLFTGLGIAGGAAQAQTVNAVMHASLRALDPNITTAYIVRNYAYLVYDTLLALDADNKVQPQMVDSWTVSPDGKLYTFKLRDGLLWHDNTPVTAEDCIASLKRWSTQDKLGQMMNTMLDQMTAVDDKTFTMSFKEPTAIALQALSKSSGVAPFMMPKRIAATPPGEPIKETIGSGPFAFVTAEYKPGVQAVFEKFKGYVPRKEPASGLAGGKVVKVDRVKWIAMPDSMTSVNALMGGEVDFIEDVPMDLMPMLEGSGDVVLTEYKQQGMQNVARLNASQPPFNNKLVRQAAMLAMSQKDVLQAQVGNPKYFQVCGAVLGCGTALASDIDGDKAAPGNIAKAKELLKEAKYDGTPVVILHPTDVASLAAMPPVYGQALRQAGFTVQMQAMDWATVTVRRASKEPVSNGGWSIFSTYNTIVDVANPLGSITVAANGAAGWFGWYDVPAIETVRGKLARTADLGEQKKLAAELQKLVIDEVLVVPLGERSVVTAKRKGTDNQVVASVPVFWGMTKTGK